MMINKKILTVSILLLATVAIVCFNFFNKTDYTYSKKKDLKVVGIVPGYMLDKNIPGDKQKYFNYHILLDRYFDTFEKICKNITFIILPIQEKIDNKALSLVDGFIITGGYDIDGKFFNTKTSDKVTDVEAYRRTKFTLNTVKYAMKNEKPLFGICNGVQAISIANGGDLIQDIPSEIKNSLPHSGHPGADIFNSFHGAEIKKNTWLYNVLKKDKIKVNSNHHQSVNNVGKNFVASAVADDGVIEAIECTNCKKPIVGFQWHPEYGMTENDRKIIKAFCDEI